jgi:hypothetical protein
MQNGANGYEPGCVETLHEEDLADAFFDAVQLPV